MDSKGHSQQLKGYESIAGQQLTCLTCQMQVTFTEEDDTFASTHLIGISKLKQKNYIARQRGWYVINKIRTGYGYCPTCKAASTQPRQRNSHQDLRQFKDMIANLRETGVMVDLNSRAWTYIWKMKRDCISRSGRDAGWDYEGRQIAPIKCAVAGDLDRMEHIISASGFRVTRKSQTATDSVGNPQLQTFFILELAD